MCVCVCVISLGTKHRQMMGKDTYINYMMLIQDKNETIVNIKKFDFMQELSYNHINISSSYLIT